MTKTNETEMLARLGLTESDISDVEMTHSFKDYPGGQRILSALARLRDEADAHLKEGREDAARDLHDQAAWSFGQAAKKLTEQGALLALVLR